MNATAKAKSLASGKGKINKAAKSQSPQTKAVRARWDRRGETDEDVREYFLNCDKSEGLDALTTMRKHVELAARAYDENVQRDQGEVCANPTCKRQLGPTFPPYNKTPYKDPITQGVRNIFTCSLACYVAVHGKSGPHQAQRRVN